MSRICFQRITSAGRQAFTRKFAQRFRRVSLTLPSFVIIPLGKRPGKYEMFVLKTISIRERRPHIEKPADRTHGIGNSKHEMFGLLKVSSLAPRENTLSFQNDLARRVILACVSNRKGSSLNAACSLSHGFR